MFISKRNKKGLFLFLLLAIIIVFVPRILFSIDTSKPLVLASSEVGLLKSNIQRNQFRKHSFRSYKSKKIFKKPSSKFDPNSYTKEQWIFLGLSEKQAEVVMKFTKYGVSSNEELRRIFVIPDELFELIKDSTFYTKASTSDKVYQKENLSTKEIVKIRVNINTATLEELDALPGIGKYFAQKIMEYRTNLGGFISRDQLLEIKRFDADRLKKIEDEIVVVKSDIQKININTIDLETLKKHPYLSWNQANSLVKMRKQKGGFKSLDELRQSVLMDDITYEKILPYLIVE